GLYNDLAYEELCLKQRDQARLDFANALGVDPNLQAALYNRATITLTDPPQSPVPQSALEDMQKAIAIGPVSPQLYRDAAQLLARAADASRPVDARKAEDAVGYLRSACELGTDPKEFTKDPVF